MSTPGDAQYTGGYHEYTGGYHEYTGGCSVHREDIMSTLGAYHDECGDIMSTPGDFSTLGGYHEYTGEIPRCMWGVIMSTPGGVQYTEGIP